MSKNPNTTSQENREKQNVFLYFTKLLQGKKEEILENLNLQDSSQGPEIKESEVIIKALETITEECKKRYEELVGELEELELQLSQGATKKEIGPKIEEKIKKLREVTAILLLVVRKLELEKANKTKINNTLHLVARCYRAIKEYDKSIKTSEKNINTAHYDQVPTTSKEAEDLLRGKEEISKNISIINAFGNIGICYYLKYEKEKDQQLLLRSIVNLYIATNMYRGVKKGKSDDVKKRIKKGDSVYEEYLGNVLLLISQHKEELLRDDNKIREIIQETVGIVEDEEKKHTIIKDIVFLTGGNEKQNPTEILTENIVNFIKQEIQPEELKKYTLKSLETISAIIGKVYEGKWKKPVVFHFPVMIKLLPQLASYFTEGEKEKIRKYGENIIEFFEKYKEKEGLVKIFKDTLTQYFNFNDQEN